jgi:hypothetical protein
LVIDENRLLQHNPPEAAVPSFENAAACPEWFARTVLEYFDRHSADRVSPDAFVI